MILQVSTFLVAFLAIRNTLNKLSERAKLVLAIVSSVVTFIPAAVQTCFAIRSMLRYDNGPWKYVRDALPKSLLVDEYAGYMQQINVATGGKNVFSYSDPFTDLYQQFHVHREYNISSGPPYEAGQERMNIIAENWLEPGVHNLNETVFSLERLQKGSVSCLQLRIQFKHKNPKVYNLGDVSTEIEEKLKRSLAVMVWCFANSNWVVELASPGSDRRGDRVYHAVSIHRAMDVLKEENAHLVEKVVENGMLAKIV